MFSELFASFPVRERGLKLADIDVADMAFSVVPRAGTWIETIRKMSIYPID